MPDLDIEAIRGGLIVEDESCDFKREINLDDPQGKSRFIDDVVAFLNRGPAHIYIGVREEAGKCAGFSPMHGDPDHFSQRVLSVIQTGVHPMPLDVSVGTAEVEGGWIADVRLPMQAGGPFQNAQSGAFLIRTGSKNTPIRRDALQGYFVKNETWLALTEELTRQEYASLVESGRMTDKGPCLHIGVLPREHFNQAIDPFTQGSDWRRSAPAFGGHVSALFQGGEVGHEAIGVGGDGLGLDRLLIRDDWFVHSYIAWPMWLTAGEERLTFHEFKGELPLYLTALDELFSECGIMGPFAVTMELRELQRQQPLGKYFRQTPAVRMIRPKIIRKMADPDFVDGFLSQIRRTTIYG